MALGEGIEEQLVIGGFTLIGIVLTGLFARKRFMGSDGDETTPDNPVTPSPLANFSGTQDKFMELVIQHTSGLQEEVGDLRGEVSELREEVETLRDAQTKSLQFEGAVRRFFNKIATYIDSLGGEMPQPQHDDLPILEHTLPRLRGRKPNTTT
jgi:hypothetical protein